jgi:hypothetical protein
VTTTERAALNPFAYCETCGCILSRNHAGPCNPAGGVLGDDDPDPRRDGVLAEAGGKVRVLGPDFHEAAAKVDGLDCTAGDPNARIANQRLELRRLNGAFDVVRRRLSDCESERDVALARIARIEDKFAKQRACWPNEKHPENTEREHWLVTKVLDGFEKAIHGDDPACTTAPSPSPHADESSGDVAGSGTDGATSTPADGASSSGPLDASAAPADASGASDDGDPLSESEEIDALRESNALAWRREQSETQAARRWFRIAVKRQDEIEALRRDRDSALADRDSLRAECDRVAEELRVMSNRRIEAERERDGYALAAGTWETIAGDFCRAAFNATEIAESAMAEGLAACEHERAFASGCEAHMFRALAAQDAHESECYAEADRLRAKSNRAQRRVRRLKAKLRVMREALEPFANSGVDVWSRAHVVAARAALAKKGSVE